MNSEPTFAIKDYLVIQVGHVYRAKDPRVLPNGLVNDRIIVQVNIKGGDVQFDGPAVSRKGRKTYPRCRLDAFRAWAGEDITDKVRSEDGKRAYWQRSLDVIVIPPATIPVVDEETVP